MNRSSLHGFEFLFFFAGLRPGHLEISGIAASRIVNLFQTCFVPLSSP